MSQLSRSHKQGKKQKSLNGDSLKTGLSAFQKLVATIASLLGIIISCMTIMTFLNKDKEVKPESKESSTTTIIKEVPSQAGQHTETKTSETEETETTSKSSSQEVPTSSSQQESTSSPVTETPAETTSSTN